MYKIKILVLVGLMFISVGSASAQSEIESLFKPDDTTLFIMNDLPTQLTTVVDGQNKTFGVQNDVNGNLLITDPEGVQTKVVMTGTGKIAEQTMPNGDKITMIYKTLHGTPQPIGIYITEDGVTSNNLLLPDALNSNACNDALEAAMIAAAVMIANCTSGTRLACGTATVAAAYAYYKAYRACRAQVQAPPQN